ncbi:hybrid nrps pks [Colletotrichum truncatum]|uniref:Hybrid nrps pks n=1 Tax=Colletotrichum truncatum TaxID=5467 RepID=A0ACC3Z011_COLTU|nr:hybrid nrps pks [Colletotrichum truncatum]KAF6800823.1 hybrid nrps pks [Colletotrichum truncatum]
MTVHEETFRDRLEGMSLPTKTPQEIDLSKDLDDGISLIIDWKSDLNTIVPAIVPSVDTYLSFKPDRTYVLFGLTSDLGQSLCDWMISHGAQNLVMTSRSPKVDPRWLSAKAKAGISVKVFANDITDEQALQDVVKEIQRTMPPIAGIANGAMVLRDKLFLDMPLEMMTETLHTKVKGSIFLDRIFSNTVEFNLDFFVFFSSIAAVTGNRAQSNYSAANMFMTALTQNRRARDLPASVMHIGAIMGVGYMARNLTRAILDNLWSAGATWISEKDFHNCFAEAVVAGRPQNHVNNDPEFIVGLRQLIHGHDNPEKVLVMGDTRFSHLVIKDISPEDDPSHGANSRKSTSVKSLLKSAKSQKSVERIVREGFVAKLIATLQLDAEIPEAEILAARADELGVDSLVSVDFRAWFSSEMAVEMPVLKLLGGSTVSELIAFSLEKLPSTFTPRLGEATEDTEEDEAPDVDPAMEHVNHKTPTRMEGPTAAEANSISEPPPIPLFSMPEVPSDIETRGLMMPVSDSSRSSPSLLDDHFTDSENEGIISFPNSVGSTSPEPTSPIKPQLNEGNKSIPLSAGQSRFWFLNHYVTDKSAFNITFWAKLRGEIRIDALSKAVEAVAAAHESLRTTFTTIQDGSVVQLVKKKSRLRLEHFHIRNEEEVKALFDTFKSYEYDLETGDLLNFSLLQSSEHVHYLVIGYHHLIMDGVSLEVLLNDIEKAYFGENLPSPVQYSEYCLKQLQDLRSDVFAAEREYWITELTNPVPETIPLLPFAKTTQRVSLEKYSHEHVQGSISAAITRAIKAVCQRTRTNMFQFLLATFAVLLNRFMQVQDFCIGMADSGRHMGEYAHSIGMYLNLLPLRFTLDGCQNFEDILKQSRRKALAAVAHGRLPFDTILQSVGVERSATHNPLFQAFINYRSGVSEKRTFCGCEGQGEDWSSGTTSYDIMLDVIENPGSEITLRFDLQESLYSKDNAHTLMDSYLILLEIFSRSPTLPIHEPSLFSPNEVQRALALGKGLDHVSAWPETVVHRIDRISTQQPGALAITNGFASSITYGGLRRKIQTIAKLITDNTNAGKSHLVGVFCEPSIDSVCSLLAVMWAGFAYVPLDPTLPSGRLTALVETAKPVLVLAHSETVNRKADLGPSSKRIPVINISDQYELAHAHVPISAKPHDNMAVHFTSGTTGIPKGVVLCHNTVVNVVEACADIYRTASSVVLQQTALNFDMALWQILVTLCSGGKLVVVPQDKRLDMAAITRLIRQEEVTLTIATPSEYSSWLSYGFEDLKHNRQWQIAVIGGEQYSSQVDTGLRSLQLPHLRLMNFYGPSEVSFVSHYMEVFPGIAAKEEPVPVGFPLYNYSAYVLDSQLNPVAPGMIGEVFIAGSGVCKGYLGNPELTNQKFLNDPFVHSDFATKRGWTRMYRSGDKGRINQDGTLSILGRIEGDAQVKIRGVRMELEEIERAILKRSGGLLEQVVVSPRGEGENKFLVAHALLSTKENNADNIEGRLREILQSITNLPRIMQPAAIIPVTTLPLTVHKKLDRRAVAALPAQILPSRQGFDSSNDPEPALSPEQQDMLRLWSYTLGRDPIEVSGSASMIDFFNLGGTSLQLLGVQAAIKNHFHVSVPVVELFKNSSLKAMTEIATIGTESPVTDEAAIDWYNETQLPDVTASLNRDHTWPLRNDTVLQPPRVVVLTGATGFVGQSTLRSLLNTPSIDTVHCLAVRDPTRLGNLRNNHKVVIHMGDLRHPSLSLAAEVVTSLAQTVDLIIHNGADVSFMKSYSSLRAPNVTSTKFLVTEIAAPRRIPITYISSVVVGRLAPEIAVFAPVSMSHRPPPPDYSDSYGASKWVSEVVLENANRDLGIPVTIRRLSSVTGTGIPDSDIMGNLVSYSEVLASVPITTKWKGVLDFVSVDHVAQAIVAEGMRRSRGDEVRYRHDCSDEVVPLNNDGISSFISRRLHGRNVSVVPMLEWIELARRAGMSDLVCTLLEQTEKESTVTSFQRLLKSG